MAIALLASTNAYAETDVTTTAIDTTGADLLVIMLAGTSLNGAVDVTDNQSNTWVQATDQTNWTSIKFYYVLSPTTNAVHTVNYDESFAHPQIFFAAYSGVDSYQTDIDNAAFAATIQPGSILPEEDGSLLVSLAMHRANAFSSIDLDFTVQESNTDREDAHLADLIQGTAAAVDPTWTFGGSHNCYANQACFLAAAGGGAALITESLIRSQAIRRAAHY